MTPRNWLDILTAVLLTLTVGGLFLAMFLAGQMLQGWRW